jgi:hypothetical protein
MANIARSFLRSEILKGVDKTEAPLSKLGLSPPTILSAIGVLD